MSPEAVESTAGMVGAFLVQRMDIVEANYFILMEEIQENFEEYMLSGCQIIQKKSSREK